jgi:hypothetical protein
VRVQNKKSKMIFHLFITMVLSVGRISMPRVNPENALASKEIAVIEQQKQIMAKQEEYRRSVAEREANQEEAAAVRGVRNGPGRRIIKTPAQRRRAENVNQ